MWISLIRSRRDNPILAQAWRRLRVRWWKSWFTPGIVFLAAFYSIFICAELFQRIGGGGIAGAFPARSLLRFILFFSMPVLALLGFVAGARTLQNEREHRTLEPLLMSHLSNLDILSGKLLGTLLPFAALALLLLPAVLVWGWGGSPDLPSMFSSQWELSDLLAAVWNITPLEMLLNGFLLAALGVVFGFSRAAHHKMAVRVFSFGVIGFLLLTPLGLVGIGQIVQSLMEVVMLAFMALIGEPTLSVGPLKPVVRIGGTIAAAWLISLAPLCELAEDLRTLCGVEEPDPRRPWRRSRPGVPSPPSVWAGNAVRQASDEPPGVRTLDIWAEYEQRQASRAQPRRALMPRESNSQRRSGPPRR